MGFPDDASLYVFPMEMFLPGSNLTPLKDNLDKIISGLTEWKPDIGGRSADITTGAGTAPVVTVLGNDHGEAIINMNTLFLRNGWGDGLPLLPATEERVKWLLTGTDLPLDTVVGTILPRGGIATVESLAVCLALAGGRPEYMPVLIAAVQALTDPQFKHHRMTATTCSVFPAVIVNGPVTKQIRLNSGYGCLGPDPKHPAGASIGRAIRLILQNMGGANPGEGTLALYGGMRFTNAVFAEDEDRIPSGWKSFSMERGFPQGANVVTLLTVASATNVLLNNSKEATADESVKQRLLSMAGFMRTPSRNAYAVVRPPDYRAGVMLIACGWAQELANYGWSKEKVKGFLWENSKLPWSEAEKTGLTGRIMAIGLPKDEPAPHTNNPEDLQLVVAGGEQSLHAYWMQVGSPNTVSSKEILLPVKDTWNNLLEQAKKDLGPVPVR